MVSWEGKRIAHIWAWSSVDDTGARGEQAQGEGTAGKARLVEVSALGTEIAAAAQQRTGC